MIRRIRELLGRPHPFKPAVLSLLLYALGCGLFVTLFFSDKYKIKRHGMCIGVILSAYRSRSHMLAD